LAAGHARRATAVLPKLAVGPAGGYTPADLAKAYGVNPNTTTSQVVAVVDAFKDPSVLTELNTFDAQYGLPNESATSFKVVNQVAGTDLSAVPGAATDWAAEAALDVQAVRGLCHQCRIVLVEAYSAVPANLATAVNTAATTLHANIISNSYGGSEAQYPANLT